MKMRIVVATAFAMLFMTCVGECFAQSGTPCTQERVLWSTAVAKVKVKTYHWQVTTTPTVIHHHDYRPYWVNGVWAGYEPYDWDETINVNSGAYVLDGTTTVPATAMGQNYTMNGQTGWMYVHHEATISIPAGAGMYDVTWWIKQPDGTYTQQ